VNVPAEALRTKAALAAAKARGVALGNPKLAEARQAAHKAAALKTGKGSDALERRPQLAAALAEARRKRLLLSLDTQPGLALLRCRHPYISD
jgi:hypothetical protein